MSSKLLNIRGLRARDLSLAVAAVTAAMAGGTIYAEEWHWSATPYVWATDLSVYVTAPHRGIVDAEIPFEDLVETLESAALVRVEGMRGEHGLAFDLFNVELVDTHTIGLPSERDANLAIDTAVGMTIFDAAGVYDAGADGQGFSLVYGARVIQQRNEIDTTLTRDGIGTGTFDTTDTMVDGLVGFRYARELPRNFSYQFAADVSTGGTEYTWSAGPTIGYTFGDREQYEVTAGYRHMVVDFDTAERIDADMSMSGVLVGFRIEF